MLFLHLYICCNLCASHAFTSSRPLPWKTVTSIQQSDPKYTGFILNCRNIAYQGEKFKTTEIVQTHLSCCNLFCPPERHSDGFMFLRHPSLYYTLFQNTSSGDFSRMWPPKYLSVFPLSSLLTLVFPRGGKNKTKPNHGGRQHS